MEKESNPPVKIFYKLWLNLFYSDTARKTIVLGLKTFQYDFGLGFKYKSDFRKIRFRAILPAGLRLKLNLSAAKMEKESKSLVKIFTKLWHNLQ